MCLFGALHALHNRLTASFRDVEWSQRCLTDDMSKVRGDLVTLIVSCME
jgi:hypothetical protein